MSKHLILIHGRDFKPSKRPLKKLWIDALSNGIERDYGEQKAQQFKDMKPEFVYYGDLSNTFLYKAGRIYNPETDLRDREKALMQLIPFEKKDFLEKGRTNYKNLPGQTSKWEFGADALSGLLSIRRIREWAINKWAPDMLSYWDSSEYGSNLRGRLTTSLKKALNRGDDILLLSHSLGTMISYDVLWKFSHYWEYRDFHDRKITKWITLGCPLGDEIVKMNLKGSWFSNDIDKYPLNVKRWINIAAEDDYIAHDQKVKDDFQRMSKCCIDEQIDDYRIYNLAIRKGISNPHHGVGYLIHPRVISEVVEWL